jgi:hypothetical protein
LKASKEPVMAEGIGVHLQCQSREDQAMLLRGFELLLLVRDHKRKELAQAQSQAEEEAKAQAAAAAAAAGAQTDLEEAARAAKNREGTGRREGRGGESRPSMLSEKFLRRLSSGPRRVSAAMQRSSGGGMGMGYFFNQETTARNVHGKRATRAKHSGAGRGKGRRATTNFGKRGARPSQAMRHVQLDDSDQMYNSEGSTGVELVAGTAASKTSIMETVLREGEGGGGDGDTGDAGGAGAGPGNVGKMRFGDGGTSLSLLPGIDEGADVNENPLFHGGAVAGADGVKIMQQQQQQQRQAEDQARDFMPLMGLQKKQQHAVKAKGKQRMSTLAKQGRLLPTEKLISDSESLTHF